MLWEHPVQGGPSDRIVKIALTFRCSTFWLVLLGLLGNWQNWLGKWTIWGTITDLSHPNQTIQPDGPPCSGCIFLSPAQHPLPSTDKRLSSIAVGLVLLHLWLWISLIRVPTSVFTIFYDGRPMLEAKPGFVGSSEKLNNDKRLTDLIPSPNGRNELLWCFHKRTCHLRSIKRGHKLPPPSAFTPGGR